MIPYYIESGKFRVFLMADDPKSAVKTALDYLEDEINEDYVCPAIGEFISCSEDNQECQYDPDAYHYLTENILKEMDLGYLIPIIERVEEYA